MSNFFENRLFYRQRQIALEIQYNPLTINFSPEEIDLLVHREQENFQNWFLQAPELDLVTPYRVPEDKLTPPHLGENFFSPDANSPRKEE